MNRLWLPFIGAGFAGSFLWRGCAPCQYKLVSLSESNPDPMMAAAPHKEAIFRVDTYTGRVWRLERVFGVKGGATISAEGWSEISETEPNKQLLGAAEKP